MTNSLNEESLELEAFNKLKDFGYEAIDCFSETFGETATLGRKTTEEIVLQDRLKEAVISLNPHLPLEAIDEGLRILLEKKSTISLVDANQHYYKLIKSGIDVLFKDKHGCEKSDKVKIIDWDDATKNEFLITRQFKISGEMYNCRADMVLFINGLPFVFIELKASHKHLENAYMGNIKHYLREIPQIFWYNAIVIVSNGTDTKVGSITSPLEHYAEWKKINSEGEKGVISLDTVIQAILNKQNLLDIIENFILYQNTNKGLIKIVGKNHQFLGVNNAFHNIKDDEIRKSGKLGVFWHTQGSGKSFSMVFLAQKVLRKIPGNWTFLIVTDREDLDGQIYGNFKDTKAVTEPDVRAKSKANLKKLLSEDHRYVFTMIQKFQGAEKISDRDDIIVFTDEAHRTQYGLLAMDMRKALPNASFMAFTGTPLMGDERTKLEFGNYVSVYNFEQSVQDKATVKLYYENRRPDLQLQNPDLDKEIQQIIDDAELNEEQEDKFYKEYANMYNVITRDDRLEKVAEDIVEHFMGRGFMGKAMYIAVDKATAIKVYDKVQNYWKIYIEKLENKLKTCSEERRQFIADKINYMKTTDMAVVVSVGQNEIEDCEKKGANIKSHRLRMNRENLEKKFKDADDPLRLVFVCAMWITGFDAACVSTIYLDKVLKEHTLMQTIARANRVAKDKNNGIIIDYIGIFKALQKALALYGNISIDDDNVDDTPAFNKEELINLLQQSSNNMTEYCMTRNIDVDKIFDETDNFKKIALCDDAVEAILDNNKSKEDFLNNTAELKKLLNAVLPDVKAEKFIRQVMIVAILAAKVNTKTSPYVSKEDIEALADKVADTLNKSIKLADYKIEEKSSFDLTKVDFDLLKERFAKEKKKTLLEQLKSGIRAKLQKMIELNKGRLPFIDKFEDILSQYNNGYVNLEQLFSNLRDFAKQLDYEDKRHMQENLSEEELAIYDILIKPAPELSEEDIKKVKAAAKELLETLKKQKLISGWRRMQSSRAKVKVAISEICDSALPEAYDEIFFKEKCENLYTHFYDNYPSSSQNIYM